MIDIEKLRATDRATKPAPWYAWIDPRVDVEDNTIATIPEEEYAGLSSTEEVIGCSEWLRAEEEDLRGIVEMRNAYPRILDELEGLRAIVKDLAEADVHRGGYNHDICAFCDADEPEHETDCLISKAKGAMKT